MKRSMTDYFGEYDRRVNPDLEDLLRYYLQDGGTFLVAICDGKVIGTGGIRKEEWGTARITRVAVAREYRRLGIGGQILAELELFARSKHYEAIVLETTTGWYESRSFYLHQRYKEIRQYGGNSHFKKMLQSSY